jgi:hypothetical protein
MARDEEMLMGVMKLRERGLAWTEVDGDVVALDVYAAMYLGANSAGALLWNSLVRGATRDSLAEQLVAEYGIPLVRAEADTDAFLAVLRDRALLEG